MHLFKATFNNDTRVFRLHDSPDFSDLFEKLSSLYGLSDFAVKYKDEEGDLVTIASDSELAEAIAEPRKGSLRLVVSSSVHSEPVDTEPSEVNEEDISGRFDVHERTCDVCGCYPIVGTRHRCREYPDYDLCDKCMANPNVDKMGMSFRAIAYPWLSENRRRKVPRGRLKPGDEGSEVSMLQKILTDRGYMTPDMYDLRVGYFGPNTTRAVNKFRTDHDLAIYDEEFAEKLQSLLDEGGW